MLINVGWTLEEGDKSMLINEGWTLEERDKYLVLIYVRWSFHEGNSISKLELMIASSKNRYLYNPALKERARTLRKNGTLGEAIMWKYVLKSRMTGFQFSRQRPVLNYIADFMCKELLLIIEVDGASHDDPVSDAARQIELEKVGFKVLRFQDDDVTKAIENVRIAVYDALALRMAELGK